jgi:hypothetical protein
MTAGGTKKDKYILRGSKLMRGLILKKKRKAVFFILTIFFLFASCATAPEKTGFVYGPPVEAWLDAFEAGNLSKEQCLTLINGAFDTQKMEILKIIAGKRWGRGDD